jgi:hypothetical protein
MNGTIEATASAPRRAGKPLLPIRGVTSLLDRNEDEVLGLIENGSLPWSFDLSLQPERARKKELRVLPASVADFLLGRKCLLEWPDVLNLLLAPNAPTLTTGELTQVLNVSNTHLLALARRKAIEPCSKWRRGPGGSGHFSRQSVINFLSNRRYP